MLPACAQRPQAACRYFICDKKLAALGWREKTSWKDGLRRTVDWYLAHGFASYWENGDVENVRLLPHVLLRLLQGHAQPAMLRPAGLWSRLSSLLIVHAGEALLHRPVSASQVPGGGLPGAAGRRPADAVCMPAGSASTPSHALPHQREQHIDCHSMRQPPRLSLEAGWTCQSRSSVRQPARPAESAAVRQCSVLSKGVCMQQYQGCQGPLGRSSSDTDVTALPHSMQNSRASACSKLP